MHTLSRVTGRSTLLEHISWLHRSLQARNPYVNALNYIQIELLRRYQRARGSEPESGRLAELLRLSVQGVATGLRTTG
ncbi:MAG: phosphoenolpyruvate carboxylase [Phycisphaeraceae bacterium]|nr:phosphoenolpyruvate carboxylase [Phycisphaeraceae bacterium]